METVAENTVMSKKDVFVQQLEGRAEFLTDQPIFAEQRKAAFANIERLSFPTSKTEAWKYTRVGKIIGKQFTFQKTETGTNPLTDELYTIPGLSCTEVVFVNGFFREDLSTTVDDESVTVMSMTAATEKYADILSTHFDTLTDGRKEIFSALNTAFATDGVFIHVKKGQLEKPVHIINICAGNEVIATPRNLIIAAPNTESKVLMSYRSNDTESTFVDQVTEVFVGENAHLSIDKIQSDSDQNFHLSNEFVNQERDSNFVINNFSLKGNWTRNNLHIAMHGENAFSGLNGLYQPKNKQHIDNHTLVDHLVPNCVSSELFKGLLYDKSQGVFNGKVIVHKDAQSTNAYQTNANILMSDDANVNSKPELEIYADDVKCSHGSTTGQFDEDALFYLMARGIDRNKAKQLLTEAFLSEVIDHCEIEAVRDYVRRRL